MWAAADERHHRQDGRSASGFTSESSDSWTSRHEMRGQKTTMIKTVVVTPQDNEGCHVFSQADPLFNFVAVMADTTHLKELFEQIRDEKGLHANTAQRVGNALLEILPFLDGTFAVGNATETWVNDNFVTKVFFESLFELYNVDSKIGTNGTLPVDRSQLNIKSMFGFWTEKYISALGKSDGGSSGGGIILNEPLESINNTFSSNPTVNGYSLLWNNDTKHWYYGAAAGGVTSVAM
ncbi:MAG: hypothetical protein II886_08435, partial [Prevotella sp.]|nr:hypothetical protein [Prevotella sp.]